MYIDDLIVGNGVSVDEPISGIFLAIGEDIRISRAAAALPADDYWLFDSRALARMHYNDDGRLTGVELDDNPAAVVPAAYWRDVALHMAVPLENWRSVR